MQLLGLKCQMSYHFIPDLQFILVDYQTISFTFKRPSRSWVRIIDKKFNFKINLKIKKADKKNLLEFYR